MMEKSKLKTMIACLMVLAMASGAEASTYVEEPLEAGESWVENGFAGEDEWSEETPLSAMVVDWQMQSIGMYKVDYHYAAKAGNVDVFRQDWPELFVVDKKTFPAEILMPGADDFPNLSERISNYNYGEYQNVLHDQAKFRDVSLEEFQSSGKHFYPYVSKRDIIMRRADSLAVSFILSHYSFTGGVHGMTELIGVNFDTETGKRISLDEVCPDGEMLTEAIVERLREKYTQGSLNDGWEGKVAKEVIGHKISWTLDARGVTFYFNPYDLAPYAAGILTATILFEEKPELFAPKYLRVPAAYAEYLPMDPPATISLRDGQGGDQDRILLYVDGKQRLHINLNDNEFIDEAQVADVVPIHVRTRDGKNYLCVECRNAKTNRQQILFYALSERGIYLTGFSNNMLHYTVDEYGENYTWQWLMTTPEELCVLNSDSEERKIHRVEMTNYGDIAFG